MSKYTTEVRYICETLAGLDESTGYNNVEDVIKKSYKKIFNFEFPIFDENYRPVLCQKILKHYYTREIGEETFGLWQLRLNTRLNEIMPFYNQLYKMMGDDEINLFDDTNLKKTGNREENVDKDGNANTNTNTTKNGSTTNNYEEGTTNKGTDNISKQGNNVSRNLYSDTPQNQLSGVENQNYLTDARKITDNIDESTNENYDGMTHTQGEGRSTNIDQTNGNENNVYKEDINTTAQYLEHIFGKSGGASYLELMLKYRDSMINIDMMIIESLGDLFINLW